MYENNISQIERKEKIHQVLTTSLNVHSPYNKISYSISPPNYDYSYNQNYSPLFVISDKG